MAKYRKRPVVIEARQWHGGAERATQIIDWVLENGGTANWVDSYRPEESSAELIDVIDTHGETLAIQTLEGRFFAPPGWWIIQGVQGEFYACAPDIFEKSYEAVEG